MPQFHIRITGDDLVFSAAHFIVIGGNCEHLHGHTYRAAADVFGPLDDDGCVVDFLAVREALKAILSKLDHRLLLPNGRGAIRTVLENGQCEATFQDRHWKFPEEGCLLLPIANTTTELLAQYIGEQLLAALHAKTARLSYRVRIELGEGSGAAAVCELP